MIKEYVIIGDSEFLNMIKEYVIMGDMF